ncbi:MAG: hypothetical protein KF836_12315 [Fimbriimonadaceae bacterium]|nr:hypothetical protein [Fimbriimonadaceae bacterium]
MKAWHIIGLIVLGAVIRSAFIPPEPDPYPSSVPSLSTVPPIDLYSSTATNDNSQANEVSSETVPDNTDIELEINTDSEDLPSDEPSITFDTAPEPSAYQQFGKPRTAILREARRVSEELINTKFYSPLILTDGKVAFLLSEARSEISANSLWVCSRLEFKNGTWIASKTEVSENSEDLSALAKGISSPESELSVEPAILTGLAEAYLPTRSRADSNLESYRSSYSSYSADQLKDVYAERLKEITESYEERLAELSASLSRSSYGSSSSYRSSSDYHVSWEYKPHVAENGSYYGEISDITYRPKTVHVGGYFRRDGTYVRGHYRSKGR